MLHTSCCGKLVLQTTYKNGRNFERYRRLPELMMERWRHHACQGLLQGQKRNLLELLCMYSVPLWEYIRLELMFVRLQHTSRFKGWLPLLHSAILSYQLTHWGREKMAAILQTTFSNEFPGMKMYEYRLKFHWSLFLRVQLTISQYCFR